MIRQIIHIDEEKCNGCGLCADACHEGAIDIIDGKAKLVRENFCDGFGDCLQGCPTGAITFEEREAPAYDEEAVKKSKEKKTMHTCPGSMHMTLKHEETTNEEVKVSRVSQLTSWPVQIKLLPVQAPFFDGCKLLIAADCTAYSYANMHEDFMKDRVTLIGCPKLDNIDYTDKLTDIITHNDIKSVTVVRMEVHCCGGIQNATMQAIMNSGKMIPWHVVTISRNGEIIDEL